jgi:hypothetical protein
MNSGGGSGENTNNVKIINLLDKSVLSEYLGSSDGERIIMNTLRRNGLA